MHDDIESSDGLDKELNDGMNKDLIDGKYKKTVDVKFLNGKTISIKYDPLGKVDSAKKQIERQTRTPKEHQHLVNRGKVLKDIMKLECCNTKERHTIELTAALLGGTKREEPRSYRKERKGKRKEKHQDQTLKSVIWRKAKIQRMYLKKWEKDAKDGRNIVNEAPDRGYIFT